MLKNPLLIILGPTASGKTKLAVSLADQLNGEIISADSRQLFRGMDIGTGKDLQEYHINERTIPYHLINIKEAGEQYNVNEFKEDFYSIFERLTVKETLPILCGGTGMYIHSILQNQQYTAIPSDPEFRATLPIHDIDDLKKKLFLYPAAFTAHADLSSSKRLIRAIEIAEWLSKNKLTEKQWPELNPLVIGLTSDVTLRREKIFKRLTERFDSGLIGEVEQLLSKGVSSEMLTFYGLEYKFVAAYLNKEHTLPELKEKLFIAICQFAKRQMTFFRKMEKDGVKIHWFNTDQDPDEMKKEILKLYALFFLGKST